LPIGSPRINVPRLLQTCARSNLRLPGWLYSSTGAQSRTSGTFESLFELRKLIHDHPRSAARDGNRRRHEHVDGCGRLRADTQRQPHRALAPVRSATAFGGCARGLHCRRGHSTLRP